jgi:hypothetical protein
MCARLIGTKTVTPVQSLAPTRSLWLSGLIGAAAVIWFVGLSGWLGVLPGSILLSRQNVLFNSDTNTWIDEMVHSQAPSPAERAIHPLDIALWRSPCRALARLLRSVFPRERAEVFAARLFVALMAGTGVTLLAWLALTIGVPPAQCVLLFSIYLLFTASSTVALPEHFGISNGLLSVAFVAPILIFNQASRLAVLVALGVLCGGTTITNLLFPLASLSWYGLSSVRVRRAIAAALVVALPISVFLFMDSRKVVLLYTESDKEIASRVAFLPKYFPSVTRWYLKTTKLHGHVVDYLNLRLLRHPLDAVEYATFAVVAPAIAPPPRVRMTKGREMVTYESGQPLHWAPDGYFTGGDALQLRDYWSLQGVGAILWIGLLIYCVRRAFRDPDTRRLAWLPAAWIVFSLLFHNLWGDELFLYAPHWSWALMALIVLGARDLSLAVVTAVALPIAVCQIYTLFQLKSALLMIVR